MGFLLSEGLVGSCTWKPGKSSEGFLSRGCVPREPQRLSLNVMYQGRERRQWKEAPLCWASDEKDPGERGQAAYPGPLDTRCGNGRGTIPEARAVAEGGL